MRELNVPKIKSGLAFVIVILTNVYSPKITESAPGFELISRARIDSLKQHPPLLLGDIYMQNRCSTFTVKGKHSPEGLLIQLLYTNMQPAAALPVCPDRS